MDIAVNNCNQYTQIQIEGNIDIYHVDVLNEAFQGLSGNIVLDLSETKYLDSAGLGLLITLEKKLKKDGGQLIFFNPKKGVKNFIETASLDNYFSIIYERSGNLENLFSDIA